MGRIELIFIGVVLGVIIAVGLKLFAEAMMEIGKAKAEDELLEKNGKSK